MRTYSKEELKDMIRNMYYPANAPGWVVKAIRRKRQEMNRRIIKPEKEIDEFLKDSGATGRAVK